MTAKTTHQGVEAPKYEFISPSAARAMLAAHEASGFKQRPVQKLKVHQTAEAIVNGQFVPHTRKVAIGGNGELADGQHLLHAIIRADKGVTVLVQRGVDAEEMFPTLDIGQRSPTDALCVAGVSNPRLAAMIGKLMLAYENRTTRSIGMVLRAPTTNFLLVERVVPDDRLRTIADTVAKGEFSKTLPCVGLIGFCWRVAQNVASAQADEFFLQLGCPADLPATHPAFVLRNRLQEIRIQKAAGGRDARGRAGRRLEVAIVYLCLDAFRRHLRGDRVRRLTVPNHEPVEFPKLRGESS